MFKRVHKAGFFAMSVITDGDQAVGHLAGRHPSEKGRIRAMRSSGVCPLPFQAACWAISQMLCFILTIRGLRRRAWGNGTFEIIAWFTMEQHKVWPAVSYASHTASWGDISVTHLQLHQELSRSVHRARKTNRKACREQGAAPPGPHHRVWCEAAWSEIIIPIRRTTPEV